jgi:uncharacterized membrane protein
MDDYLLLKTVHIVSATILFGTGLGTAFHMWMSHLSGSVPAIAVAARNTVIADFLFTTPAVVVQPATGVLLAVHAGIPQTEGWLLLSIGLYLVTGACWVPVVWLQVRMHRLADAAPPQAPRCRTATTATPGAGSRSAGPPSAPCWQCGAACRN